ncbi:hypothetical protein PB2503_03937 [Parvularcula bermudensis HTCC2503]|uniref:DUF4169 family protein n=1 Tax=Parvularcula bermudensis (strain ATCC BAA-594 / HTCC2503 / KCTC 12087) TaxID=314260 RepID=E0TE41_PARBH|nr:DUF4169 family protein [Parvularcula bermudensis]ADM08862.1 hypothetical protein PB2503_03937 [Parvularcula bermudensis HTCC2503]
MSGDLINLRLARKRKARAEKERQAAANRATHGRSKADRQFGAADREKQSQRHEGHRLTDPEVRPSPVGIDGKEPRSDD